MENELLKTTTSKKGGKRLKFEVIHSLRSKYSIPKMCERLGVTRAGYYKYLKNIGKKKKESKNKELKVY